MGWPSEYAREHGWLNPWPTKYLTPANKWLPTYYPPEAWQIISSPPAFDGSGNRVAPMPPPGEAAYWWLLPRETWPYRDEMPWEAKVFGAWPASQVLMSEDLPPSIWPGGHRTPPFGFIKVKMPGTPDISGDQAPKGFQIPFVNMKMHMRWLSPDEMKVKTAITPLGPRYYFQAKGWEQHVTDYKEFQSAMRARRRAKVMNMLADEIIRTKGKPKPNAPDLFS
jgi:hypothetical protein